MVYGKGRRIKFKKGLKLWEVRSPKGRKLGLIESRSYRTAAKFMLKKHPRMKRVRVYPVKIVKARTKRSRVVYTKL